MVRIGEVEPVVSDPREEFPGADIISSGGEDFGAFAASRWPQLASIIRSRRARIIAVPVLAGAVAAAALLVVNSPSASGPGPPPPGQQITIANTGVRVGGVVGPYGWVGPAGCRRGRSCPEG
jgi:hypothetical protein